MRTWWQLLRQRGLLGTESVRARRGAGIYIADRALRLAAEVLEPRCLLTDATGLAADDGGGDILVDASQWDDAGLTLLRDGDLVHLVRTGTTQDVIAPFPFSALARLVVQGRDDLRDVLTVDITSFSQAVVRTLPFDKDLWNQWTENGFPLNAVRLKLNGGLGAAQDELRLTAKPEDFVSLSVIWLAANQKDYVDYLDLRLWNSARAGWWCEDPTQRLFEFGFDQFEQVSVAVSGAYSFNLDHFSVWSFGGRQHWLIDQSNATADFIVPPDDSLRLTDSPGDARFEQGLDEPRDEDATLPETLVTDAESDGEDSGLNELDGQESNPDDEDDSTETASTTWDDMLTNPLLTDELLDGGVETMI